MAFLCLAVPLTWVPGRMSIHPSDLPECFSAAHSVEVSARRHLQGALHGRARLVADACTYAPDSKSWRSTRSICSTT